MTQQIIDIVARITERVSAPINRIRASFQRLNNIASGIGGRFDNINDSVRNIAQGVRNLTSNFKGLNRILSNAASRAGQFASSMNSANNVPNMGSSGGRRQGWNPFGNPTGGGGGGSNRNPPPGSTGMSPPGFNFSGGGRSNRGRGGGGGGGGIDWNAGIGGYFSPAEAFGFALQQSITQAVTNALMAAFQMFMGLISTPLNYFVSGFKERIEDEMSDVKTAGGLFSISNTSSNPIFKSFRAAELQTKETNRYLAQLAGSLPGSTNEYVQISKQIADGIYMTIAKDEKNSVELAKRLAEENKRSFDENQPKDKLLPDAATEIIGEFTKLTTLAGLGAKQGPYGLPILAERMISEEQVSLGMFERYAAIFREPMIRGTLQRNVEKINKESANTAARLEAIMNAFEEVITPELVRRYMRTFSGILERLNTSLFDPEVGLLGLGRALSIQAVAYDAFGRAIDDSGKAVEDVADAALENLSVFEYVRDIFFNISQVLFPITDSMAMLFDPFQLLGTRLMQLRESTMSLQRTFETYNNWFVEELEKITDENLKENLMKTLSLRATMSTINNALAMGGVISYEEFLDTGSMLEDFSVTPDQLGTKLREQISTYLSSDLARQHGKLFSELLAIFFVELFNIFNAFVSETTKSALAEGFVTGFVEQGGKQAIVDLIKAFIKFLSWGFMEVVKTFPVESAMFGFFTILLPAILSGLSVMLIGVIPQLFSGLGAKILGMFGLGTFFSKLAPDSLFRELSDELANPATDPKQAATNVGNRRMANWMAQNPKATAQQTRDAATEIADEIKKTMDDLLKTSAAKTKVDKLLKPGAILAGLFAISDFGNRLKEGQPVGQAAGASAGGAAGSIIGMKAGAAVGSASLNPLGVALGAILGTIIGYAIGAFAGQNIGTITKAIFDLLSLIIQGILYSVGWLIGFLVRVIVELIMGIGHAIGSAINFLKEFFTSREKQIEVWNSIQEFSNNVLTYISEAFSKFGNAIKNGIIDALGPLASRFGLHKTGSLENDLQRVDNEIGSLSSRRNRLNPEDQARLRFLRTDRENIVKLMESQEAVPQYKGSFGTDNFMPLPKAIESELANKPPGSNLVIANSSELIIPTKAAANGNGDISVLTAPLNHIASTNSNALQYLNNILQKNNEVKNEVSQLKTDNANRLNAIASLTSAVGSILQSGIRTEVVNAVRVEVVNTPTVTSNFSFGGEAMGPIGGGIGNFPMTSPYGWRDGRIHRGNDYGMPIGTKLALGIPGQVLRAEWMEGYGMTMDVMGADGVMYRFAHLSRYLLPPGASVVPSVPFGLSGNTGRSTGPHLHFEAHPGGRGAVNPTPFAGVIRANYAGMEMPEVMGAIGGELANMPYGSDLVVGNSSEIMMKPNQAANLVSSSVRAGMQGSGSVTVSGITINVNGANKSGKELAEEIASHIMNAIESANYSGVYG